MDHTREYWIDNVKVVACILVVLGHFFQSMVKAEIIPDSNLFSWFNKTIYLFHVHLFFICSGFLYQEFSDIHSFKSWVSNIRKKLVVLGVPFLFFSSVTGCLKTLFSSYVNVKTQSLIKILLLEPIPPYWYLYCLFFLFVVTITIKNRKEMYILLGVALFFKILKITKYSFGLYFIDETMKWMIWFVLGMTISYVWVKFLRPVWGLVVGIIFILFSLFAFLHDKNDSLIEFILGLMACYAVLSIMKSFFNHKKILLFNFLAKYTMPIFLMHTLFAAPFRSVLLKLGISNSILHVVSGLVISFVGPIIAMIILERLKPMDFLVYPSRYL